MVLTLTDMVFQQFLVITRVSKRKYQFLLILAILVINTKRESTKALTIILTVI